jgi:hypothetical protein
LRPCSGKVFRKALYPGSDYLWILAPAKPEEEKSPGPVLSGRHFSCILSLPNEKGCREIKPLPAQAGRLCHHSTLSNYRPTAKMDEDKFRLLYRLPEVFSPPAGGDKRKKLLAKAISFSLRRLQFEGHTADFKVI